MAFNWRCPHCNHNAVISYDNFSNDESKLKIENADGIKQLTVEWIICPNEDCKKLTLEVFLSNLIYNPNAPIIKYEKSDFIKSWKLIPQSNAKVYPDYIPKGIKDDYKEACSIKEFSPKASATLSRRCIQGMIRDFFRVKEKSLYDEIEAIKDKVDPTTWKSITSIRKIGNIGAHMEKDINLIIDVDPKEAQLLINLIEILIKDWYINRHERESTLESVISIADDKAKLKKGEGEKKKE